MNEDTLQIIDYILAFGAGIITGIIICTIIVMIGTKTNTRKRDHPAPGKTNFIPNRLLKDFNKFKS